MPTAYYIKVSGIVQGVGFRPFVYRLARAHELTGWVLNAEEGVEIHLEGEEAPIQSFLLEMKTRPPQAATIAGVETENQNPGDRRFHAQPVACSDCGPHYFIQAGDEVLHGDQESVAKAADYL